MQNLRVCAQCNFLCISRSNSLIMFDSYNYFETNFMITHYKFSYLDYIYFKFNVV